MTYQREHIKIIIIYLELSIHRNILRDLRSSCYAFQINMKPRDIDMDVVDRHHCVLYWKRRTG